MWKMVWFGAPQEHLGGVFWLHLKSKSAHLPCLVRILFTVFNIWRGKSRQRGLWLTFRTLWMDAGVAGLQRLSQSLWILKDILQFLLFAGFLTFTVLSISILFIRWYTRLSGNILRGLRIRPSLETVPYFFKCFWKSFKKFIACAQKWNRPVTLPPVSRFAGFNTAMTFALLESRGSYQPSWCHWRILGPVFNKNSKYTPSNPGAFRHSYVVRPL